MWKVGVECFSCKVERGVKSGNWEVEKSEWEV